MMNCKSITTPMVTNLKKLNDSVSDSYLVDPNDIQAVDWILDVLG